MCIRDRVRRDQGMYVAQCVCVPVCLVAAGSFLFETRLGCLQLQVPERTRNFIGALQDMLTSSLYLIVGEQLHQKLNTPFWRRHADSWDRLFAIAKELVDERRAALGDGRHSDAQSDGVYLTYLLSNKNIDQN